MKKLCTVLCAAALLVLCALAAGAVKDNRPYTDGGTFTDPYYFYPVPVRVVDGVVYTLNESEPKHYEVVDFFATQELAQTVTTVRIAAAIDGVPVTAIRRGIANEDEVRENYDRPTVYRYEESYPQVQAIELPETLATLGIGALRGLDGIKRLELPETVTTLEEGALSGMKGLQTLVLPASVTALPRDLCRDDAALSEVVLKGEVERIGMFAFQNCVRLKHITLPQTPLTIDCQAFEHTGLTALTVPANTTLICGTDDVPPMHFAHCRRLRTVTFESRSDGQDFFVPAYSFAGCKRLKTLTLPTLSPGKGVYLEKAAFKNCYALKALRGTASLRSVDAWAFALTGNSNRGVLKSVTLPAGLRTLAPSAFLGHREILKLRVLITKPSVLKKTAARSLFLKRLPLSCTIYVKTETLRQTLENAGSIHRIVVKADLK